jgi:uncharacterized membrane protein
MNIPPKRTTFAITGLLMLATSAHGEVTFTWLDDAFSAMDISPDGKWIVGQTDLNDDFGPDGTYLYNRETDTMLVLPPEGLNAVAVSDDGRYVVGEMPDPDDPHPVLGVVAAMWSADTNEWTSLGYLPDALECPSLSNSYEISADGSVVIGLSWEGCNGFGFIWTEATGMLPLENLANGTNRASVISADGTLVGGFAQGTQNRTPCIWDSATQLGTLLDPPDGDAIGEVFGIKDDGSILLGSWWKEGETPGDLSLATKWTADGGGGWNRETIGQGNLLFGWLGVAMDVADNGTIVGFDFNVGNRRAWIQPNGEGDLIFIGDFVEDNGGTLPFVPTTPRIEVCQAISTDGRYIIGHDAFDGAWIVEIIPDCPWDTAGEGGSQLPDGQVGVADFFDLLQNWGPNCPQPFCIWDTTGPDGVPDGEVGVEDFFALLQHWGPCP